MMKFTRTSMREMCSAIVNQARKVAFVLSFLALVLTVQPHSVDATTLASVGIKHQAQGAIDEAAGRAEAKLSETKGMARQAKGKATRDIGRVESKAGSMKRKADGAIDDSKNMLDDLGSKIQSTANGIADSVKDLAK